jgi:Ca2+-binding RTX toxin-like protein
VVVSGDLSGTGLATNTITVHGGTGNDIIDLSGLTSTEHAVINGGGGADLLSGGAGANTFVLDATALSSAQQPTPALAEITNLGTKDTIDLQALLDAAFGPNPTQPASNVAKVTENADQHSATLSVDTGAGTNNQFVAIAHLDNVLSGANVTAILDHAHHTAQLHVA